ncbi:hypothetical protein QVD17_31714 [Tagetes erecta]|uniref:ZF-HD dimerization-type domain-containing protein n=1 Tax=Tagetes erecta TaxID=13708 RepID=A0AAD8K6S1_TARER|nr:hypothetical protein QVD17_31714 [Tagetes erecta]
MDLKHSTTITATATVDSPATDHETPLHFQQIQPLSSFPIQKNHHHHHEPPPTVVAYKQCLKNHAATIGSHALDGCCEFIPSLTCTPHQPTSLTCAACGCHRNFHCRDPINNNNNVYYDYAPHILLPFNTSPTDQNQIKFENPNARKRFRTKFSQNQKEKMYVFAEKLRWKMQRCDDQMVLDFCNEVGIKRGIFKVWMHNNKNTLGKKDYKEITCSPIITTSAAVVHEDVHVDPRDHNSNSCYDQENGGGNCSC